MSKEQIHKVEYSLFLLDTLRPNPRLESRHYGVEKSDGDTVREIHHSDLWKITDIVNAYATTIRNTGECEIEYSVKPGDGIVYRTLPRGAYTLSLLALNKKFYEIHMLLLSGAVPDEEFTKWIYGEESGVWEDLNEFVKKVKG